MTSKGTDRLPAMVHRSHRGCVQLQPCWRPGQRYSQLNPLLVVLDGVYNVFTLYASSSSTRKTTRTASALRTGSVGSSGRRRVGRLTVSARWKITILLVFPHFKSKRLVLKYLSPRCFLPLRLNLSNRSGCLSNHERLHSQPQVISGTLFNSQEH